MPWDGLAAVAGCYPEASLLDAVRGGGRLAQAADALGQLLRQGACLHAGGRGLLRARVQAPQIAAAATCIPIGLPHTQASMPGGNHLSWAVSP